MRSAQTVAEPWDEGDGRTKGQRGRLPDGVAGCTGDLQGCHAAGRPPSRQHTAGGDSTSAACPMDDDHKPCADVGVTEHRGYRQVGG